MFDRKRCLERPYRHGVGLMLLNAQKQIFVAQRIDTINAWQMPQGGIDQGEDPEQALFREIQEEIGTIDFEIIGRTTEWVHYDLPEDLSYRLWNGLYRGQKQLWFCGRFKGQDKDINLQAHHPEFSTWKWVPADQLVPSIISFKQELYANLIKEFAHLLK